MVKLKLGYGVELPIIIKNDDDYIENENIIKKLSNNFDCIQIMFSKSKLSSNEIKQINSLIKNYKYIYVHASYKINIGSDLIPSQDNLYNSSLEILLNEIIYATKINANGIVIHIGKNVKNKYDTNHIYNNMVNFIVELFKNLKLKKISICVLLETSAGQGGEMCWKLNEFVDFICKFSFLPFYTQLGVCIDTCHIFQAGYDLNNSKVIQKIHNIFSPIQDKIKLIHLNNSFHKVGMHIDKHEQIGHGHIHTNKLIKFILPYKLTPMILETVGPYDKQIKLLTK